MNLSMRAYQNEADYWNAREFLRQVFRLNGKRQFSWDVARFDYWRWHCVENIEQYPLSEAMFIWETGDGQIAALLTPEGKGEVFFHTHPGLRTPDLDVEMLSAAEEHLSATSDNGRRKLQLWANQHDPILQELLAERGYIKSKWVEYQRRRPMEMPIPDPSPAEGYRLRALGDEDELPERSYLSWRAFHPDEPDERYEGWEWYKNVQRCPLYRRDLDLVAVAPNGDLAGFCTVWLDDVNRMSVFEPVGVEPAYHRRGLGKALMYEGLRRVKRLGATMAYVGSYSTEAGALYASVGFTEYDLSEMWEKEL